MIYVNWGGNMLSIPELSYKTQSINSLTYDTKLQIYHQDYLGAQAWRHKRLWREVVVSPFPLLLQPCK